MFLHNCFTRSGWLLLSVLSTMFISCERNASSASPPNILIITVDNLGYADLKTYNPSSEIITPNLDKLAQEGVRLTSFYTASPTCTVSRASLLTGRIPQRYGLTEQLQGIKGNFGAGLRQSEILIPQVLKTSSHNYATGAFGKWNIGFAPGSRPTERGFDEFVGFASGNIDYYHHVYNGKHDLFHNAEEIFRDGVYSTDLFADAAIRFIERQSKAKRPWFVYLPFNAPHFPNKGNKAPGQPCEWQAPDWAFKMYGMTSEEKAPEKRYMAVVTALDRAIGRVLKTLDQLGVSKNTFVFLYSDNGAFMLNRKGLDVTTNEPLREGGVTLWEGGIRVLAFAKWPEMLPQGSVSDAPLWSLDLLPTCVELSEAVLPKDRVLDGKSMLGVLTGKSGEPLHEALYFEYGDQVAMRRGNWKIIRTGEEPWELYDVTSDIGEQYNLADRYTDIVKDLTEQLNAKRKEVNEQ